MTGYLEILGAVLIWAVINGLLVKGIKTSGVGVGTWMSVVGIAVFGVLFIFSGNPFSGLTASLGLNLALLGLFCAINNSCFYTALKMTEVYNAALVHYFAAPLAVLTVMLIPSVHEAVSGPNFLAVIVGFVGLIIIAAPNLKGNRKWLYFALGSAVFYSLEMVWSGIVSKGGTDPNVSAFAKLASQAAIMPLVGLLIGQSVRVKDRSEWKKLIFAGVLLFLSFVLFFGGMATVPVKHLAVLGYIDRIGAIVLAAIFFKERLTRNVWLGGGLIILADVILAVWK